MKLNHVTLPVDHLDRSVTFYERLGLETIVYAPPRYARLASPGGDWTISVEVMPDDPHPSSARAHVYLECDRLDHACAEVAAAGLQFEQAPKDMPYLWREARLRDPDGHDVRLYWAGQNRLNPPWRLGIAERANLVSRLLAAPAADPRPFRIELWKGSRQDLRPLFSLADDSAAQIEQYVDKGDVIVALADGPVGHLQVIEGGGEGKLELKSLAVARHWQRRGVATKLVAAVVERCRNRDIGRLIVSTAACSLGALRFYLACGFRVCGVVRDAFSEAAGYPPDMRLDGLPLNDALVLELDVAAFGQGAEERP